MSMATPFLIILDGMMWAGKTTTARLLGERFPRTAIIGMDRVKRFLSDFERWEIDNGIAKDIVFGMTEIYFKHGISVIIDQPFANDAAISPYADLAGQYNIPLYGFQLYTTPEHAFQRVINRQKDKTPNFHVPEERIRHNIWLFAMKDEKNFLSIDTSEISSEDVVKIILERIWF